MAGQSGSRDDKNKDKNKNKDQDKNWQPIKAPDEDKGPTYPGKDKNWQPIKAPDEDKGPTYPGKDNPNGPNKPGGNNNNGNNNNGNNNNNSYDLSVVPGKPNKNDPGAMNVVDYAGELTTNPSLGLNKDNPNTGKTNESMFLEDHLQKMDTSKGLIDGNAKNLQMDPNKLDVEAQKVDAVKPKTAETYNVDKTQTKVASEDINGAEGTVSKAAQIKADQIDTQGIATGVNKDGTKNFTGEALAKYAAVDMSNIIDTSTAAGKLLAQQLGDGNYVDSKATLQGQLELLQSQFVDPMTGEPKIPSWAAGTARNVSKIAAFKGMSGTAATAAMSQALLEASIPIAQADAQFFQTLTVKNLDNRQQSVINTANTLAKFEQTNVDNRMAAAIQNSKAFLEMDMANLSNEQQSRVINNQNRVQSILEDSKQENAKRLFVADNQNEMDKFYDSMNTQIKQYNSSQNLDAQKFSSTLEDSREKFYKEMQYNIDVANAKWRQEVQLTEDSQQFAAATQDVKNMVDLSVSQLNQIWDRSDALLDYAWKSSESDLNRKNELAKIALAGDLQADAQMMESLGMLAGTFVGSGVGQSLLKGIFGM